jgi:hypothetical protein
MSTPKLTSITNRELLLRAFPNVDSRFGAPKGRMSVIPSEKVVEPFDLRLVRSPWVDYDYDVGGAYWGATTGTHIYCGWHASGIKVYVRASGVSDAADRIIDLCPPNSVRF